MNGNVKFWGISTLIAQGVRSPNHIVVGYAALDRIIRVCESVSRRRINLQVIASTCSSSELGECGLPG